MRDFLLFTFNGLTMGCVLALLSLGWVMVYRVSGILNLAQGSFMVIGALTFMGLSKNRGWPLVVAMVAGLLASVATALTMDTVVLRPARSGNHAAPVIITLGVAEVLTELSRRIWGNYAMFHPFMGRRSILILGVPVTLESIVLWVTTLTMLIGAWLLFERTLLGKALQACAEDRDGAQLVGINPQTARAIAFSMAGAMGAVSGILLSSVTPIGWDGGLLFGIKGFVAAIVGGFTYPGAIAGGILLGLTENYTAGYINSGWKNVVSLSALIVVLLVRPEGLAALRMPRLLSRRTAATDAA